MIDSGKDLQRLKIKSLLHFLCAMVMATTERE
jgi:hypothetical protein